jgi:hypothetical protein
LPEHTRAGIARTPNAVTIWTAVSEYWNVDEARAYLPRLRELLRLVADGLGPGPEPGSMVLRPGAEHAEAALAELSARSIVLRQVGEGLVDFPAVGSDGELYLLCWREDESDLAWWHRPDEGFAGRHPLPLP